MKKQIEKCWRLAGVIDTHVFLPLSLLYDARQTLPSWEDYQKSNRPNCRSCRVDSIQLSKKRESFIYGERDRLSRLPDELLLEVVKWLDPQTQCALRKTSVGMFVKVPRPVVVGIKEWNGQKLELVEVKIVVDH
jgi:hypothetical protein